MSDSDLEAHRIYRNESVRLSDLTALEDVVDGVTFANCEILGPAVIVLLGDTHVNGCHWSGDAEAVIWPAHGRTSVVGAIGLKDCVISQCQFYRVGIFVPDEQMAAVRAGFGLS